MLMKHLYQYLDLGLQYHADGNSVPTTYYDSGGKTDPLDSKAQHGHAVMLGRGPVCFLCRKHKNVASAGTMGKEWMALAWAVKDTVPIRGILREMGALGAQDMPSPLIGDNLEAVGYATKNKSTKGMKHVPAVYNLTREWVAAGEVVPLWIEGDMNPSDMLSKPVARQVITRLRGSLAGYDTDLLVFPVVKPAG